ncbi:hypothetical protein [Cupriavidus sp. H18C2]|uniref:hypothetical protein n=1 Tax=Cupriavidus sp. H18C2 TaxID=3241602 RepID=UPI003BF86063
MLKDTSPTEVVGTPTAQTVAKQHSNFNDRRNSDTIGNAPRPAGDNDVLEHCAGRLSCAHELAERLRPILLAIERLADTDHTIAGLASIGSETLEALVADICGTRDDLNEQVRIAQRSAFCDFVERSTS